MKYHFKPVAFVHLPRTGGTLIRDYIEELNTDLFVYIDKHQPVSSFKKKGYYKFGLIRNPFDWYLSQYYLCIQKVQKKLIAVEKGYLKGIDAGMLGYRFFDRFPTIDHFIDYGTKLDNFWLSNSYDHWFDRRMDYIGKLENIYDDVNFVLHLNNIYPGISLKDFKGDRNETIRPKHHYCYNSKSIDTILKKDSKIFKEYGYQY